MGDSSGINKILRNPAVGLLPLLVFSIIVRHTDVRLAVGVALALSAVGHFVVKRYSRLIYDLSLITFAVAMPFSFFVFSLLSPLSALVFVEIIFVLSLILMRLSRAKILLRLAKNNNPLVKNYLTESFRVSFQTQYGLFAHLLIVLLYYVLSPANTPFTDMPAIGLVCQIILIIIIVSESIRLNILDKKLYGEEWLPVVTEQGNVTGRVAKSVTQDLKNKFMHPVVRVALIYKGRIYLKARAQTRLLDPGLLDYPFEKYMQFDDNIDEAVHETIRRECGSGNIPLRFLLKYIFENEHTKRLIFLYVSDIEDEALFNGLRLSDGKLWTEAQIDDNMGVHIFSECFELEFEYLKNTVLMVRNLKQKNAAL